MRQTTAAATTIVLAGLLIGCGGSSTSTRGGGPSIQGEGGEAGSTVEPQETGGSTEQTGGSTGETGGTGGIVGGGTGGMVEQTGGSGNEPGTGGATVCTPKTCLTYAVEMTGSNELQACGLIEDGCGNYIDCGGCENPSHACGGGSVLFDATIANDAIEGICNGGCGRPREGGLSELCLSDEAPSGYPTTIVCTHAIPEEYAPNSLGADLDMESIKDDMFPNCLVLGDAICC